MVLTIAKLSVGSVLKPGDPFLTLMPLDTPLEAEIKIARVTSALSGLAIAVCSISMRSIPSNMARPKARCAGSAKARSRRMTMVRRSTPITRRDVRSSTRNFMGVPDEFPIDPGHDADRRRQCRQAFGCDVSAGWHASRHETGHARAMMAAQFLLWRAKEVLRGKSFCHRRSPFDAGVAAYDAERFLDAFHAWKDASKLGHAEADHRIALLYEKGEGVRGSIAEAVAWHERAAQAGHLEAQYKLALIYRHGVQAGLGPGSAETWRRSSEERLGEKASSLHALIFPHGTAVAKNSEAAFRWAKSAADAGKPGA